MKPADVDLHDGDDGLDEDAPQLRVTRQNTLLFLLFVASALAFLYFVLPQITGLEETWGKIEEGDPWWLIAAGVFTVLSFLGYVVLFRGVFRDAPRIDIRASYQITMAGLAATRLFAAGGAGGLVLQAWALRAAGMPRRRVADQTLVFLMLTYIVYMIALVVCGFGLFFGIFRGPDGATTLIPAIFGLTVIVVGLLCSAIPTDLQRRLDGYARRSGRFGRLAQRLANGPAAVSAGIRGAWVHVRAGDPAVAGAVAYWAFNIMVLWAAFHAFGGAPGWAVLVLGYFTGMLGNLLPLPGGVGGVDGGMIGAFAALGVDAGTATVAVLVYRAFAFWLPTIPGAIAYFQLRHTVQGWRDERREQKASQLATATA
ncbi:MAG: flippase-like domain-containing protein [Solirubrobacteraceae bacterium]|nr:flippase-like domain-containing protein [Solirubrobacteraceae bacterium]